MNQDVKQLLTEIDKQPTLQPFCVIYARIVDAPPSDDKPILFQKFVPELMKEAGRKGWILQTAYPEVDGFAEALTGRTAFVFRRTKWS